MKLQTFAAPTACSLPSAWPDPVAAQAIPAARTTEAAPWPVADSAHVWRLCATAAQEDGDSARALQCWREVALREPNALDAMFHIACCHARLHEAGRACLILDSLAHSPRTPEPLRQRCLRLLCLLEPASG